MAEHVTCYRCSEHGLISEDRALGSGAKRSCGYYVTNAQCRKPVKPVPMVTADVLRPFVEAAGATAKGLGQPDFWESTPEHGGDWWGEIEVHASAVRRADRVIKEAQGGD